MRVVVALGGNALLKRAEPLTVENQRRNVARAATAIARLIAAGHQAIVTHGNGPQVGLMALQDEAYDLSLASPLDVLGAESEGMIGYLIEQELANALGGGKAAAILTRIEVDPADPAFGKPSKPIGPVYGKEAAAELAARRGWMMMPDGAHFRRAVASPRPQRILEIAAIRLLIEHEITVICAGGGGIPVVRQSDGTHRGAEAVIDKDRASALLARDTGARALLMLTDVDGVYLDWGTPEQQLLRRAIPAQLRRHSFAAGSMGPKIEAALDFVGSGGAMAGIGRLEDALDILEGKAGTAIAAL
ncbi:MAG TPA: carbamate kinase [Kiloniellales bacterium]|nr:carbamate kinase [Aestuariivirga sp.]